MTDETYSEAVRNIISDTCGIPASSIEDSRNLSELGLDSIQAIEIISRIEAELGVKVALQDVYPDLSILHLTEAIKATKG
jgi:acyl carrier protein